MPLLCLTWYACTLRWKICNYYISLTEKYNEINITQPIWWSQNDHLGDHRIRRFDPFKFCCLRKHIKEAEEAFIRMSILPQIVNVLWPVCHRATWSQTIVGLSGPFQVHSCLLPPQKETTPTSYSMVFVAQVWICVYPQDVSIQEAYELALFRFGKNGVANSISCLWRSCYNTANSHIFKALFYLMVILIGAARVSEGWQLVPVVRNSEKHSPASITVNQKWKVSVIEIVDSSTSFLVDALQ